MRSLAAVVVLLMPAALAQAQEVDKDKLRQLVTFPSAFIGTGVEFSGGCGWYLFGQKPGFAAQYAKLPEQEPLRSLRLAGLLGDFKAAFLARLVDGHTDQVCVQRRATDPDNIDLLLVHAQTLDALEKPQDADRLLQRALQLAPANARVWLAVAKFHQGEATRAMWDIDKGYFKDMDSLRQLVMQGLIPKANADRAAAKFHEARDCANRAVELAPKDWEIWWGRAMLRFNAGMLDMCIKMARCELVSPVPVVFSQEMIDDLKEAARLNPGSGLGMAGAAYFDWMLLNARLDSNEPHGMGPEFLKAMPATSQEYMRMTVAHLEKVFAGADPRAAAEAGEALICMAMVMTMDFALIEKHCRRVVQLNPSRGPAWALLVACVGTDGRREEALTLARQCLKHVDTADAHYHCGRALERNGFWQDAEREVRLALERDPNHVPARLGLAACLLRNGSGADDFARAGGLLDEVEKLPAGAIREQNLEGWKQLQAVRLALQGDRLRAYLLFSELTASHKGDVTYQQGAELTKP